MEPKNSTIKIDLIIRNIFTCIEKTEATLKRRRLTTIMMTVRRRPVRTALCRPHRDRAFYAGSPAHSDGEKMDSITIKKIDFGKIIIDGNI